MPPPMTHTSVRISSGASSGEAEMVTSIQGDDVKPPSFATVSRTKAEVAWGVPRDERALPLRLGSSGRYGLAPPVADETPGGSARLAVSLAPAGSRARA